MLVEPGPDRAATLHEQEHRVMSGDPTDPDVLRRAHLSTARALVADVTDDENASIVLAAREVSTEARIITLVEDASLARYHRAAGADVALSPRRLLGRSLASKVPLAAAANIEEAVTAHGDLDVAEVAPDAQFDVRVVGAWIDGAFTTPVDPDRTLREGIRLFVAGPSDRIADLRAAWSPYVRAFTAQSILLAGYGDSGHTVESSLRAVDADVTVLDTVEQDGVDVVGDVRDEEFLTEIGADFVFAPGDEVIVAGTDEGLQQLQDRLEEGD